MSRSRREKKRKNYLMIIVFIICIVVVGITFWMLNDIKTRISNQANNQGNTENNIINNQVKNENIDENTIEVENTTVENEVIVNNTLTNTTKNTNTTSSYKPASTNKKQEAINLVKKSWGEDSTVDFSYEYINENGEYVVSVKDKSSATVKCYFKVNIATGSVELD